MPLRDQVTDHIRSQIVSGDFEPGARLIERELAEQLGVSRVPVREALRRLESEGFVTVVPRRGVVVRPLTRDDLEDLFDVREALEVQAVRLATRRGSAEELAELERAVAEGVEALALGDQPRIEASNKAFHDIVVQMAHNELLTGLLEPLQGRLSWLLRQNADPALLCREHEQMYAAIAARRVAPAGRLAAQHVHTSRALAMSLLFGDDA